eukprot:1227099-Pyramimonas_sp.AAC.1
MQTGVSQGSRSRRILRRPPLADPGWRAARGRQAAAHIGWPEFAKICVAVFGFPLARAWIDP